MVKKKAGRPKGSKNNITTPTIDLDVCKRIAKKTTGWACDNCGELHDNEIDALKCCANVPKEVECFACLNCETLHETAIDALKCCNSMEEIK